LSEYAIAAAVLRVAAVGTPNAPPNEVVLRQIDVERKF
jgi:hypothetical protein